MEIEIIAKSGHLGRNYRPRDGGGLETLCLPSVLMKILLRRNAEKIGLIR